jgi:hypothetical protein
MSNIERLSCHILGEGRKEGVLIVNVDMLGELALVEFSCDEVGGWQRIGDNSIPQAVAFVLDINDGSASGW